MVRLRLQYSPVHGNTEIRETLTTFFSSGTKGLLTFLTFSFSTRGERERDIFYYADCSYIALQSTPQLNSQPRVRISTHWPNKRVVHPVVPNWTGLAQAQKSTRLAQRQISTNCFFQKSPKFPAHCFWAWRNSHPSPFPIWGFYYDICDRHILRARAWTVLNVCTCTCTKPNSSKPNQTKWSDITNEKWLYKKNPSAII